LEELPGLFERGLVDSNGCHLRLPIGDAEYEAQVKLDSTLAKLLQPVSSLKARRLANMVDVALNRGVTHRDEIRLARKLALNCLTCVLKST